MCAKASPPSIFTSGQEHFELLGYKEGRIPYRGFELEQED